MKSWMYVVPFIQILYTVVNGTCTKGQSCELREWVQWDCKNCCTMNAEPDSAIRKRKICCAEQDDLAMCLVHCNISKDSVEEKGLCKDHCKCSGAFPMPLITIHAAGVSVNNGPALHVTTAFRKPSTNSPGNPSSNITVSRTAVTSTVKTQKSSTLIANLSNADHTVDSATKKITDSPVFISMLVLGILAATAAGIIGAYWFSKKKQRQIDTKQNELTVPDTTKN